MDSSCSCTICQPRSAGGLGLTRSYIHHMATKETSGAHLLSIHNVHYMLELMQHARQAIVDDRYPEFVREFFTKIYGTRADFPRWATDSLKMVNIEL